MIRLQLDRIKAKAAAQPPGYLEALLEAGKVDGEWLVLSPRDHKKFMAKFRTPFRPQFPPKPERISPVKKVINFTRSLRGWARDGFKLAAVSEVERRRSICLGCPHWHRDGNFGLGECGVPACGCSKAKWHVATQGCPLGKWDATALHRGWMELARGVLGRLLRG
jgi:hypothetical protein